MGIFQDERYKIASNRMKDIKGFLSLILDSIADHITVIDSTGTIQYVNKSWTAFAAQNGCLIKETWLGVNYIEACDKASEVHDDYGAQVAQGIRSVIDQTIESFYFEYPCHSPKQNRWFMMRVTPLVFEQVPYFVISHHNISERKLAEEKVRNLARMDGLTNIANRRYFDEFLNAEWRRCLRLELPISLAIIDLDHFKLLNDTYGHQHGDQCLIKIGQLLKQFVNRSSDICARYGGEEFAIVLGNTSITEAQALLISLLEEIAHLDIANPSSTTQSYLTASIGLSTIYPSFGAHERILIHQADNMLYKAKKRGRNRLES